MNVKAVQRSALVGSLLGYLAFLLSKGTTFASTILLSKLLSPDEFGLMAIGLFVTYLEGLTDFGVGAAFVFHLKEETSMEHRRASTAFIFNVAFGCALAIGTFIAAPTIGHFFHEPRLDPIIQLMSVSFLITSLGNIHESWLRKNLQFHRRFIADLFKSLTKAAVSIVLALNDVGVLSLVWGQLAGNLVATISYWVLTRWRPRWVFDPAMCRSLTRYGAQITLMLVLGTLIQNLDYVFIGRLQTAEQLGLYTMAFRLPELIILNICCVISPALFPTYARLQNDRGSMQTIFLSSTRYIALICFPLGIGTAIISGDFVRLFFSERWESMIPVMRVLSLYATLSTIGFNAGDIYKALGRPSISNKLSILHLAIAAPALWLAAEENLLTVAWAQVGTIALMVVLRLVIAGQFLDIHLQQIARAFLPATIGVTVMTLSLLPLISAPIPVYLRFGALIITGFLSYLVSLMIFDRSLIRDAIRGLTALRKGVTP